MPFHSRISILFAIIAKNDGNIFIIFAFPSTCVNTSASDSQHHSARRLAGAGGILMGSQVIGMVLQLLIFSTIQHQLSQADNGTFFWIQQISGLAFLIVAEMGMNSVVIRMYVEHQDNIQQQNRIMTTFFGLRLGLWLITTLGVCGFALLTEPDIIRHIVLYAVYLGIAARGTLFRMVLEIRRRAVNDQMLPALAGISDIVLMSLAVLALREHLTLWAVMTLFVLTSLPGFIVMLFGDKLWHRSWREFDKPLAVLLLRETAPILVSIVMMQVQDKCDTIALDAYFGREALGAFGAIMRVVVPCISLLMVISGVIAPVITRLQTADVAQCKQFVLKGVQWTVLASVLCAVMLGVFAQEILIVTAGRAYQPFASALVAAAWTLLPGMVVAYLLAILTALGLQRQALPMMIVLALGALVGNSILTATFGIMGSIAARIAATVFASAVGLWALQRFLGGGALMVFLRRTVVFVLLVLGVQMLAIHLLRGNVDVLHHSPLLLVLSGIVIIAVSLLCAFWAGILKRSDIQTLRAVLASR